MNIGEFDWKYAKVNDGVISAAIHAIKYLVIPLVLISVLVDVMSRFEEAAAIGDLFQEMIGVVLVFGALITVLGFFKGAYPKGTYVRLSLALAIALLAIYYAWSLLLDGRVQDEFADQFFDLDFGQLFFLYLIGGLFNLVIQLGEFIDHRRAWLERNEMTAPREREDPKDHRMYHDFRLRYGSLSNGLRLAKKVIGSYLIVPMVVIIVLKAGLTSLNIDEIDAVVSSLDDVLYYTMVLGTAIAFLSFFKGFYPKGSFSRLIPAVAIVLISMYWIWTIGMEGKFVVEAADVVTFSLDYAGILLLLVCASGLWGVYFAVELWCYRREWKEGGFQKDALEDERGRRKREERKKRKDERAGTVPPQESA